MTFVPDGPVEARAHALLLYLPILIAQLLYLLRPLMRRFAEWVSGHLTDLMWTYRSRHLQRRLMREYLKVSKGTIAPWASDWEIPEGWHYVRSGPYRSDTGKMHILMMIKKMTNK